MCGWCTGGVCRTRETIRRGLFNERQGVGQLRAWVWYDCFVFFPHREVRTLIIQYREKVFFEGFLSARDEQTKIKLLAFLLLLVLFSWVFLWFKKWRWTAWLTDVQTAKDDESPIPSFSTGVFLAQTSLVDSMHVIKEAFLSTRETGVSPATQKAARSLYKVSKTGSYARKTCWSLRTVYPVDSVSYLWRCRQKHLKENWQILKEF